MNIFKIYIVFTVLFLLPFLSQSQNENADLGMVYKIKQEGLKNSGTEEMAFWLTDFVGPRLTGSTGNNHGNEWAKKKMEELGLQNVRIEPAREFSRGGWDNQKTYAAMTSPYYTSFACNPVAWTGSTTGMVKGEVLVLNVKTEADQEQYKGNIPRSNGANYTAGTSQPIAELNLPNEDFARMERLLRHNVPVEMEIDIQNKFFDSPVVNNVIGEIPGTDKTLKTEVVMLGAHIDSWHGGTGAADNASGCVVMHEAIRILKSLDIAPRRTIRIALWGGEEQGLNGSSGYVEKYLVDPKTKEHKPEFDKFAGYFNMDNGSGKYRGIYMQENELVRPIFEEWFKPFADMGASTTTIRNTSGTDHLAFDAVGLPGFQFSQDAIEYGRGYHTTMDTYERLVMDDLKQNAVITASFVYNAAMRQAKLPGKPVMKGRPENERRLP